MSRRAPTSAPPSAGSRGRMRSTPTNNGICCRTSTWRCGAVSRASKGAARSGRGCTAFASHVDRSEVRSRLYALIHRLTPVERQLILLYLEGCDAASIGEITGMTPGSVATRVHRIKRILADRYQKGSTK